MIGIYFRIEFSNLDQLLDRTNADQSRSKADDYVDKSLNFPLKNYISSKRLSIIKV
ncbi:hypothetical protein [Leptospira alexanderi]|uniref:hypothetical protein n=1 Tax=Leptospira alexanderi TaxID=100053 RepID=UPI00158FEE2F|nr:hypothetical protein [Leptospira alexanderi]